MTKNYNELVSRLDSRMNPDRIILNKSFSEELRSIPQEGIFQYIKRAMQGVELEYTNKTIEAGKKVIAHLKDKVPDTEFDFQGSVMTNTHIKGNSDIDILEVCNKFYTFDRDGIKKKLTSPLESLSLTAVQVQILQNVLNGGGYVHGLSDLRATRMKSEEVLKSVYNSVEISKPKSIKVELTYPKRKVDVVIANWYKNAEYYLTNEKDKLGVKIFVKGEQSYQDKELKPDFPFRRISMINSKDNHSNGRLKKMIRFMKNMKFDSENSEQIKLSSFDINAICFDINLSQYIDKNYIDLVVVLFNQLSLLYLNKEYRNRLKSVDGSEFIFIDENGIEKEDKVQSLRYIYYELHDLIEELRKQTLNPKLAG